MQISDQPDGSIFDNNCANLKLDLIYDIIMRIEHGVERIPFIVSLLIIIIDPSITYASALTSLFSSS